VQILITLQSRTKAIDYELINEVKYQTSARPRRPSTSYHQLGSCPHTKARLGVYKKLLKVALAQGALKLKHLKVFALPLYKEKCQLKTLRCYNFDAL